MQGTLPSCAGTLHVCNTDWITLLPRPSALSFSRLAMPPLHFADFHSFFFDLDQAITAWAEAMASVAYVGEQLTHVMPLLS